MEVILVKDVASLGKAGDLVKVAPGHARNYLLPQKLALPATPVNLKLFEVRKERDIKTVEANRSNAVELKKKIEETAVTLAKQAGESDKLFGSVTSVEIAGALSAQGIEIDKKQIQFKEGIKRLGDYTVRVKMVGNIYALLKVQVIREEK